MAKGMQKAEHKKVTLEVHFAVNYLLDTVVHLLYIDDAGAEVRYAEIAQGSGAQQSCYAGNAWLVRGYPSREVYCELFATSEPLQVVMVGAEPPPGSTPGVRAVWALGTMPRESLLFVTPILLRLLTNLSERPADSAVRSIKRSNATIGRTLAMPHAAALLSAVGFAEARSDAQLLSIPPGSAMPELPTLLALLVRLDRCLKGLEGIGSQASTMVAVAAGETTQQAAGSSHRCASCRAGIHNDVRMSRRAAGSESGWRTHEWNAQGEFRYHCEACSVDLCASCYDRWKAGAADVHPLQHALEIKPPITTSWGGSGYGAAPAPPSLNARPRRGPFG